VSYATISDLVDRYSGEEIAQRGWPERALTYLGAVSASADLAATFPSAVADDCALVTGAPAMWRYDGASWAALSSSRVDQALADADDEIDSYLMGRYTLPLAVVPGRLKTIACDIARYRLFDDAVPEAIASRYEQAVRFLRDVGTGRLNLGLDGSDQAATPAGGAQHDGPERVFSMDTLEDF